jgi:hypothetical protein
LALMRPPRTADERPVLARNRTSQGLYRLSIPEMAHSAAQPRAGDAGALAKNMSVRTAYWMAITVFVLVASAVWFGWVAGLLR